MNQPIYINAKGSLSALGKNAAEVLASYNQQVNTLMLDEATHLPVSRLNQAADQKIQQLRQEDPRYKKLDRSVLMAMYAARQCVTSVGWQDGDYGINIGSSRGATGLFEQYHKDFLDHQRVHPLTSPTTTLGNIASWVGQDLHNKGIRFSHSITCSTAFHALLNGIAWLNAGMSDKFLIGGSEAALTPFTLEQMRSVKLYSNRSIENACQSLKFNKEENTLVLGEAAAVFALSHSADRATAKITGYGFAGEKISNHASISADAQCFQDSMKAALRLAGRSTVDAIVMHAPGTLKGDLAEYKAVQKTFEPLPALTTNKWKIGHTFGASGAMSLEMAMLMLDEQVFYGNPYYTINPQKDQLESILLNSVGFGGNAVSIIIEKT